ncbi:MAG: phospholipase D family protein [Thermoleophilaceae bacterium]
MRYLDSADRDYAHTMHAWLSEWLPDARCFACQTGYFRATALRWFEDDVVRILDRDGEVHLVIGANEDRLIASDLEETVELLAPWLGQTASFTVVTARDVLFHPKTYYCESRDGTRAAAIGSANLTPNGLGGNVEASLAFDDDDGIPTVWSSPGFVDT